MSNEQFNLRTPEVSGNSRRNQNQSPWSLVLFGVPFLFFGLIALIAAIHDPKQKNVSVAFSVGGIFICVGLGIIIAGFRLRKRVKQTAGLQAQHPDKPWLWRADWAEGRIKASTMSQPKMLLIMGLAFCSLGGVSTFFALPEVWQKHNYLALLVLFFQLAGIGLLIAFINAWRSVRRFGDCRLELAQIPAPVGGVLEGMVHTGAPLQLEHELKLKITCNRRVEAGKETTECVLWEAEKNYSAQAGLLQIGDGTGIPVHFKLPAGQPQCVTAGNVSIFWRLEARSKLCGPDFHAIFDLPVFQVVGTETAENGETETEEADPTAALQASVEEIRRDENSKIKISDGPDGREFYFPAARNIGTALFVTLFMLVFNGAALLTHYLHATIVFPIVFGLVGVLMILGTFSLWFKSSRITINPAGVRAVNRYLLFSRTRQFPADDVARFATKTGMQSGTQIFTDIKLIPRGSDEKFAARAKSIPSPQDPGQLVMARFREAAGPSGVTVAGSIASIAEANWLVSEMNKALGRSK